MKLKFSHKLKKYLISFIFSLYIKLKEGIVDDVMIGEKAKVKKKKEKGNLTRSVV